MLYISTFLTVKTGSSSVNNNHETNASLRLSNVQIHRASVRATTFDGKTIYLRRKPKVVPTNRNVSPENGFLSRLTSC